MTENNSSRFFWTPCMIPVDLSANCEGWIYDPNGSGIQILGIRSRDPCSGSTDMSDGQGRVKTGEGPVRSGQDR